MFRKRISHAIAGHEEEGEYAPHKVQLPPPARFKTIKPGDEPDADAAAAAAKRKKGARIRRPPPRAPVDQLSFRGDSYKGVHVYL
jgi:hypothetical protein